MSTSVLYHAFQIEGVKCNSTSFEGQNIIFQAEIAVDVHLPPSSVGEKKATLSNLFS